MDPTNTPQFKNISAALDFSRFRVAAPEKHEVTDFELYVGKTAKLIGRSYIATAKLVERWPLEKIVRHYELCTKHAGTMPGDVKWWWLRKRERQS